MKKKFFLWLFCLTVGGLSAQNETLDLQGIFTGKYRMESYLSLSWRPGTRQFTFVKSNAYDTLFLRDAATGKTETLLTKNELKGLLPGKRSVSLVVYEWLDQNTIFFPGMNVTATLGKEGIQVESFPIDYKNVIAYDAANALFIVKETDGKVFVLSKKNGFSPILLSSDTGKNIVFGEAVHRNEWGINEGEYISPSGKYIAFYRMDESMVEEYPLVHTDQPTATVEMIRYPMAGRKSHAVKVGIFNVEQSVQEGKPVTHYINTDPADGEFLTQVTFHPLEKFLYVTHVNREQNQAKLVEYDLLSGNKQRVLITENDDRYVEPHTRMRFLKNDRFLWQSDRDGWNHCYLYELSGKLVKQLTRGNYEVIELLGTDPKEENLYFISNKEDYTGRFAYQLNLKTEKLTNLTPRNGTHAPLFSDNYLYLLDQFENTTTPGVLELYDLAKQKRTPILTSGNPYRDSPLGETKLFTVKNSENTELCCRMIYPPGFDERKKYPVFLYVYGGPHSQLVTNTFLSGGFFLHYMAQKGYLVFTLDNRGTDYRGAEFEKCIHRQVGTLEVADQMVGIHHLKILPYVDTTRIGVDGWSYGGFMTLSLVTLHPETFRSASCGGPVVDWKWYEVMYGERYMDTPEENPEGYAKASILPKIKNLQCELLVMHGALDNTVVWQNSLELLRQSITDRVQLDYFVYPNQPHNVRGPDRVHLWNKIEKFHEQYLKNR